MQSIQMASCLGHACYLISPLLSTFLTEFIYRSFIQSLELGIHLEEEFPDILLLLLVFI